METKSLENRKTLTQKLWDKGKYFIPFYGGWKATQKGKAKTYLANTICTVALAVPLILYGIGSINGKFSLKDQQDYWTKDTIWNTDKREGYAMDGTEAEAYTKSMNRMAASMAVFVMAGSYARYRVYKKHFSKSKGLEHEVEKS